MDKWDQLAHLMIDFRHSLPEMTAKEFADRLRRIDAEQEPKGEAVYRTAEELRGNLLIAFNNLSASREESHAWCEIIEKHLARFKPDNSKAIAAVESLLSNLPRESDLSEYGRAKQVAYREAIAAIAACEKGTK